MTPLEAAHAAFEASFGPASPMVPGACPSVTVGPCGGLCRSVTAAIGARDASDVEVERTMREALAEIGVHPDRPDTCRECGYSVERCGRDRPAHCTGRIARAALARVASLKGGNHG